jgi:ABC-type molybdate transport system substrate-binding protein
VANTFTAETDVTVAQTYMPSGTLRQEIEGGLRADVFASADTASPQALAQKGSCLPPFLSLLSLVYVRRKPRGV